MKINRPTDDQAAALNRIEEPRLKDYAQYSNNRVTDVRIIGGASWCKLNGESIRTSEAFTVLRELFE